jgi:hypothetical protein
MKRGTQETGHRMGSNLRLTSRCSRFIGSRSERITHRVSRILSLLNCGGPGTLVCISSVRTWVLNRLSLFRWSVGPCPPTWLLDRAVEGYPEEFGRLESARSLTFAFCNVRTDRNPNASEGAGPSSAVVSLFPEPGTISAMGVSPHDHPGRAARPAVALCPVFCIPLSKS